MIEIDASELTGWALAVGEAPQKLHREMLTGTRVALGDLSSKAKEFAPVDDGPLRADIRVMGIAKRTDDAYSGRVGTDLVYSAQREYGGTILPRNSKYLVFEWDQARSKDNPRGLVFAKSVTQTGSLYMKRAEDWMQGQIDGYYQLAVNRSLQGVFG